MVTVTATLTKAGSTSKTSIAVPINGKPTCTGSCLTVEKVTDTFPSAAWKATPVGFQDDDDTPLR
jgi:hypothetical protein